MVPASDKYSIRNPVYQKERVKTPKIPLKNKHFSRNLDFGYIISFSLFTMGKANKRVKTER